LLRGTIWPDERAKCFGTSHVSGFFRDYLLAPWWLVNDESMVGHQLLDNIFLNFYYVLVKIMSPFKYNSINSNK
jgi:hypothetical protein